MKILERSTSEIIVPKDEYVTGMLYVVNCLTTELFGYMIKEDRCFGIVRSYWNSIEEAYDTIYEAQTETDLNVASRIMFLLKPSLVREFKWLSRSKRLSEADSLIVLCHKILDILVEVSGDHHIYKKEIGTIWKVITRLFDNIRNRGKEVPMYILANDLRMVIGKGIVGKHESILSIIFNQDEIVKEPIVGSGVRIKEESEEKIIEVSLE